MLQHGNELLYASAMAKVDPAFKASLLAAGKWADFVTYRDHLKASGLRPVVANRQAVDRFSVPETGTNPLPPLPEKKPAKRAPRSASVPVADVVSEPAEVIGGVPPAMAPVPVSVFEGKAPCGEIENITWVCDNMRNPDVIPDNCPSMRAWNLLLECRENAVFRMSFWRDHYSKTVTKPKEVQDDGGGAFDGSVQVETLKKVTELAQKCGVEQREARQAHNPEVSGSIPAPATNVKVA